MGNTDLENTSGYCAFAAHPGFSGSGNDASPCPDGRGNVNVNFTNNIVHDSENLTGAYVCAHGTNFDGNIGYFFGFGGSSGFQGQGFYGRGLNGQMVNNVIWGDNGSGWPIQIGGYGDDPIGNWIVSNNTLVDGVNNDGCIATYNTDFTNLYMVNNICMNAKYLTASGDWNLDSIGSASYGPNWEAHNNMIYYDGGGVATNVCGGAGQNCSHVVDGQITNNYTLNTTAPGFVGSGANKYALTNSSSYAFQKGVITNAPSDAINMPARGNPYDLGAYQLLGPVTSGISYYIGNTLYTCNGQLIAVSGGGMPSPVCSITDQMTGSNNDTNNMAYEYYAGQGGYKFPSAKTPCQVNVSINSIQAGSMSGKTVRISIFKNGAGTDGGYDNLGTSVCSGSISGSLITGAGTYSIPLTGCPVVSTSTYYTITIDQGTPDSGNYMAVNHCDGGSCGLNGYMDTWNSDGSIIGATGADGAMSFQILTQ